MSPLSGKYDTAVDAKSAYEMLQKRIAVRATPPEHRGLVRRRIPEQLWVPSSGISSALDKSHSQLAPSATRRSAKCWCLTEGYTNQVHFW